MENLNESTYTTIASIRGESFKAMRQGLTDYKEHNCNNSASSHSESSGPPTRMYCYRILDYYDIANHYNHLISFNVTESVRPENMGQRKIVDNLRFVKSL